MRLSKYFFIAIAIVSWVSSAAMITLTAEVTEHKRMNTFGSWQSPIHSPSSVTIGGFLDAFDSEVKRHGAGGLFAILLPSQSDLVDVPASRA